MAAKLEPNMGPTDRVLRSLAGSAMLLNGLSHFGNSPIRKLETAIGGAFLVYGLSGFDPLLKAWGASTLPGAENNLWNHIRSAMPGQGIRPILTQRVQPRKPMKPFLEDVPFREALTIG